MGHRRAAREVAMRLSEGRLVTLTGPGGSGKTRLALHVAQALVPRYTAGAWWCDLGPVSDPAFVPQAVAAALGVSNALGSPLSALMAAIGAVAAGPGQLRTSDRRRLLPRAGRESLSGAGTAEARPCTLYQQGHSDAAPVRAQQG